MTAGGGPGRLVGGVGHFTVFTSVGAILQALQRDRVARAVAGQARWLGVSSEGQEELCPALVTTDPGEAGLQHAAVDASEDPLSTFAMDVDTGSHTLARRYLLKGSLLPIESVRVEEFVNYFQQDFTPPERGAFAIHVDGPPLPWGDDKPLVRVGIQGRPIREARRRGAMQSTV